MSDVGGIVPNPKRVEIHDLSEVWKSVPTPDIDRFVLWNALVLTTRGLR